MTAAGRARFALAVAFSAFARPAFAEPPPPPAPSTSASTSPSSPPPPSTTSRAVASAPSAPSAADAAKEKRARQARAVELHDEAKVLYERGLYRRAIAKLEAAIELDPEGKELVYNLALIHEKLAEPDIAEGYYVRYIDMETDPKARERALATVKRIRGAKKGLEADILERTPLPVATSTPVPSVTPVATAAHASRAPSPVVLVIGGVALGALGIGIGFGVSALTTHPGSGVTTSPSLTAYELETRARTAHAQAIIADLALVTSLVIGATATVLYLVETRSPRRVPVPVPVPMPAPPPAALSPFRTEAPF